MTGAEGLIGKIGRVRQPIVEDGSTYAGMVFVYGSLWKAESATAIPKGSRVRVESVEGLTIYVVPE